MVYCTPEQVRGVLSRDPAGNEGTAASLPDDALADAIEQAQAEVDAKLSARWSVPFQQPPDLVVGITCDIAGYLADLTYRKQADYESEQDPVLLRYQRAEQLLKALVDGAADLPGTGQVTSGVMVGINPYRGDMFTLDGFGLVEQAARVRVDYPL